MAESLAISELHTELGRLKTENFDLRLRLFYLGATTGDETESQISLLSTRNEQGVVELRDEIERLNIELRNVKEKRGMEDYL
ncbi:MAG: hypothetical protein EZS28_029757 [Streblomastix strix]|uniref:Centrosomin N-terminal motif 1 domain-containing protein n=1 Tax=Streblomastix strix TaxID=222440 RepID=A0A5J4UWQ3_9EUKA|nr:MAG: hypothetical protein EZS28_029757 [Streblomastix strix]